MDFLWSPWRYRYVSQEPTPGSCFFCEKAGEQRDRENYLLCRGRLNFVLLNVFPYTSGHLMIAPYAHVAGLSDLPPETLGEMMELAQRAERALRQAYRPDGLNLGMNLGQAAGAGVAGHVHLHILPRWFADSNFMTTVAETRVLPEDLPTTYEKLRALF